MAASRGKGEAADCREARSRRDASDPLAGSGPPADRRERASPDVDTLVVEARRDGRLRSYAYNGSGELNAERILERAWSFVEQHVRGFR